MKRVLITGRSSYVGNSVEKWLLKQSNDYQVTQITVRDGVWKDHDFSKYDTVFHVAGIAHSDIGKASEDTKKMYYQVNRDLTIEIATKAKASGVRQFIFMSSMIIYGESAPVGTKKMITKETMPMPANFYGDSKLQAEMGLDVLKSDEFKVAIVRSPMIYGSGSKGNYSTLSKFAQKLPVFPDIHNERSMLYIEHLCEFIRLLIANEESGVFFPQNVEYVKTSEMVKMVANTHGKRIRLTPIFNPFIRMMSKRGKLVNKVFGNSSYEMTMSEYRQNYRMRTFIESINLTES